MDKNLNNQGKRSLGSRIKQLIKRPISLMAKRAMQLAFFDHRIAPSIVSIVAGSDQWLGDMVHTYFQLNRFRRDLKRIAKSGKPIIVGPFISEIGFEVLYWVPFLTWFCERYDVPRERVFVVSRGGPKAWYCNISDNYVDIMELHSYEAFSEYNRKRIAPGGQKQKRITDFDRETKDLAARHFGLEDQDPQHLHPLFMYLLFERVFSLHLPVTFIKTNTVFRPLRKLDLPATAESGPGEYYAVKFYFNNSFPDTEQNRAFIRHVLRSLAAKGDVYLFSTGLALDDHSDFFEELPGRIFTIENKVEPSTNLDYQTRLICNARAFVGTYGGFSYIAPFYGVPSVSFYSVPEMFLQIHLDVALRAYRELRYGNFEKDLPFTTPVPGSAKFAALDVRNFETMSQLFGAGSDAWSELVK